MVHPSWSDYPHLLADLDMDKNKNHTFKGKPLDVLDLSCSTEKRLDWKCSTCEHRWKTTGSKRVVREYGCPACANYVINNFDSRNSMTMTHPNLVVEYQGNANLVTAGTGKKLDWNCVTCEHEWKTTGSNRVNGTGCPACVNRVINNYDGRNSMVMTHPDLAKEYQGDATKVIAGTNKKIDWKCSTCEHEWKAQGNDRVQGKGCPACVNQVIHTDGRNSMAMTHPDLASEYQGDANLIIAGTNKKLDWKCSTCEHEWNTMGGHRVNGTGCPACANLAINNYDGRNSMANTHSKLAEEYLGDATNILAGTNKKIDWKCSTCEHEWKAQGNDRVQGKGCPACVNQVIHTDGRNSMAMTHPDLASEYQGDANLIIAGTNKKLDWKCSTCEHEWNTMGGHRVNGSGCPACSGRVVHSDGRNSMFNTYPQLAEEYQGDANLIVAGTSNKLDWNCITCEYKWEAAGYSRVNGSGCPACVNKVIHKDGRNSMTMTHPDLASEYQGDAKLVVAGTNKKLDWKCSTCEHTWKVRGADRASGSGCPACVNRVVNSYDGRNSMAFTHPELAKEYQGDANILIAGTNSKLDWKCIICNHEWKCTGNNRVNGNGCPACAGYAINNFDGRNTMAITHPQLAEEYQGDATKIIAGTSKKLDWICSTCGHQWQKTGNHRVTHPKCGACDNKVIHSEGKNAMASTHPELASECLSDASQVVAGTMAILDWKCLTISETPCGYEWKSNGDNRSRGIKQGCPKCGAIKMQQSWYKTKLKNTGSMQDTHPKLAQEYQGDATKVVAGTNKRLLWKCSLCDFEWRCSGGHRVNGTGCPACANYGYDPSQIGYVYIHQYIDETNHWLKCGITNHPEQRHGQLLRSASRANIEVKQYDIFKFDDGWLAQQCERDLLNMVDIRFNSEYDIEGKAEFFKYSALEEIKNIIEKYL